MKRDPDIPEDIITKDTSLIHTLSHVPISDVYPICRNERVYIVEDDLSDEAIAALEDEGMFVDVSSTPFGWCSASDQLVTGIDTHRIIHDKKDLPYPDDVFKMAQALAACTHKLTLRQLKEYCNYDAWTLTMREVDYDFVDDQQT